MGLATFRGGVHPYEGKELSENKPVQTLLPKGDLVYPMSQHIGAPAKPLVAVGDAVLAGQKIGEAGGFISANVICSVSGKVKAIEPRRVANGAMVTSIVVENDIQSIAKAIIVIVQTAKVIHVHANQFHSADTSPPLSALHPKLINRLRSDSLMDPSWSASLTNSPRSEISVSNAFSSMSMTVLS